MQPTEGAIRFEQGAIRFHGIDGPEDIFGSYGKDDALCILLTGADDTDNLSIIVEDGGTTVTGVGRDGYLASQGIALKTRFCAHIPFIINDLIAGVAKRK